jgi:hypothetical protein
MRKRIIMGAILSVLLVLLLPSIPAVESNAVIEEHKTMWSQQCTDLKSTSWADQGLSGIIEQFRQSLQNLDLKNLRNELLNHANDESPQPQCFPISGILFYTFIFIVLLWIVFKIVGLVVGVISGIVGAILSVVLSVLTVIIGLMIKIGGFITGIIHLITGVFGFIARTILTIVTGILTFIGTVAKTMIQFYGKVIGLILNILMLIYKFIFPGAQAA